MAETPLVSDDYWPDAPPEAGKSPPSPSPSNTSDLSLAEGTCDVAGWLPLEYAKALRTEHVPRPLLALWDAAVAGTGALYDEDPLLPACVVGALLLLLAVATVYMRYRRYLDVVYSGPVVVPADLRRLRPDPRPPQGAGGRGLRSLFGRR